MIIRNFAAVVLGTMTLGACATKGYVRNQVETGVAAERAARTAADSNLSSQVTGLGNDLNSVKSDVATLKTDVQALRRDLTALRDEFGAKITAMENGMKFAMPVTFAFDDATIRDEDRAALDRFTQVVNKYYGGAVLTVEGHADPAGTPSYNKTLSLRRAESVSAYLAQAGLAGVEIRPMGMGETRQVVKGAERDAPGAQANRRVVFIIEAANSGTAISSIQP
jgi:peptidoglycan-associated lipoprotein